MTALQAKSRRVSRVVHGLARAETVAETPWRERPLHTMQTAAEIAGVSPASLYRVAAEGRLKLRRLAGRTLVDTPSLISFIETAEDWQPSNRATKACAARVERARAAWQE